MKRVIHRFRPGAFSFKHLGTDALLIVISLYLSLWLRLGEARIDEHLDALNRFALIFLGLRLLSLLGWGVYQSMWRYISIPDALTLGKAVLFSVPLLISATYVLPDFGLIPRSLFFIDAFVVMALLMGARLLRRRVYEGQAAKSAKATQKMGKVIIYGAGTNGRHLAQRFASDPARNVEVLGFIDDDPKKRDRRIGGLQVIGNGSELEELVYRTGATDLIVAITNPPTDLLRQLVVLGRKYRVRPQVINNLNAQAINPKQAQLYRQVELSDLLNRAPAQIDLDAVRGMIRGRRVLVTGAGGSIGSELARQVSRFEPARLLLLDHSEFNLYEIDRELRPSTEAGGTVVPLLLDIKDKTALARVFEEYRPEVILHAAAYKHVHLVEANPFAAVLNNVLGTKNLLELAEQFRSERFLLISTDKAVNPGGVMGATKRVCELLVTRWGFALQKPFSSVRFGNVLGSSGSLIPLLRQQIQDGGPITLTHPDMTRYFMLIPEAVSLVLMSSYLSQPGDISVLRMGEPIRIFDLAKSLLALMGRNEEEVPIMFTGVRPGEKMFEELYLTGDELTTPHEDILTVPMGDLRSGLSRDEVVVKAQRLIQLAESGDPACLSDLRALVASDQTAPRVEVGRTPSN